MYLSLAVVGVRAFALGKAFFRYSERLVLHDATFRKATFLRTTIYGKLVERAPIGLSNTSIGALLSSLVDDTEESLNIDLRYRPALIQSVAVTIAGAVIYIWLVPNWAWLVLLVLILGTVGTYLGSRVTFSRNLEQLGVLRSQLAELSESLVARAKVIRAYGWHYRTSSKVEELGTQVEKIEKRIATATGALQGFIAFAMYASIASAILVAFYSGVLLPGEQVAVLVLLPLGIFEYLQAIPNALQAKQKAEAATDRIKQLNDAPIPSEILMNGAETLTKFESLEIQDASVQYPDGQIVHLPNLKISAGQSISLIAKSGAGKSTLAKVVVGFIKPVDGVFTVNDKPIISYKPASLMSVIGLVEQQPVILAGTIRDNLLLAKPEANDGELAEILGEVGLWKMLESRDGLDTDVGVAGSKLSGGESQRLALVRNLLAKRDLIILDEPTSSVTRHHGMQLVQDFLQMAKKRKVSIILISHDKKLTALTDRSIEF